MLCSPDEGGITLYVAAQGTSNIQEAISKRTGLPQSKVSVKYRRVGGGFGGKAVRTMCLSVLAAEACLIVNRPVRLVLPRETDCENIGGRQEMDATWRAAVEPSGKVTALAFEIWLAHGASPDLQKLVVQLLGCNIDMVYGVPNMEVKIHNVKQHVPPRTTVRGPGHCEAVMLIEAVFCGVATLLGLPQDFVREANFYRGRFNTAGLKGGMVPPASLAHYSHLAMWDLIKTKTKYAERRAAVDRFNEANRFKKRGLSIVPARYGMTSFPGHTARVDIFKDGSVQIAVSGSEIGQGLHTKVGQLVSTAFARALGAGPPMKVIRFLETSTEQIPNANLTGGSTTSECSAFAAESAVDQLVKTLKGYVAMAKKNKNETPGRSLVRHRRVRVRTRLYGAPFYAPPFRRWHAQAPN